MIVGEIDRMVRIRCDLCGSAFMRENSRDLPVSALDTPCSDCDVIEKAFPTLFKWILRVVRYQITHRSED